MGRAQELLPEFDRELEGVRRTLERVPEDRFDWQPHPKSTKMGRLAAHLATLPSFAAKIAETESFEIAPAGKPPSGPPPLNSRQQVLESFEKNRDTARAAIAGLSDEQMALNWTLSYMGKTVASMPRERALRTMVMSHLVHHRAQLGVYLRLNDVPVPSLYGPSADEQM